MTQSSEAKALVQSIQAAAERIAENPKPISWAESKAQWERIAAKLTVFSRLDKKYVRDPKTGGKIRQLPTGGDIIVHEACSEGNTNTHIAFHYCSYWENKLLEHACENIRLPIESNAIPSYDIIPSKPRPGSYPAIPIQAITQDKLNALEQFIDAAIESPERARLDILEGKITLNPTKEETAMYGLPEKVRHVSNGIHGVFDVELPDVKSPENRKTAMATVIAQFIQDNELEASVAEKLRKLRREESERREGLGGR